MSSSVTEAIPNGGKLLVHISENGRSFELDCNEGMLVEDVMRLIESVTRINCNDQVILSLDVRLESQRPLSAYKLPADDREVFLFDRTRLQSNSPPPPPEQVDILEVVEPPSPSSSQDSHPLDNASDPALKALPSYEREFRYHYHKAHTIFSSTVMKLDNCERLLREQKVQERALEVARGNLDQYYKMINQNYTDFMKRYLQQYRVHSDLLVNWRRDIEKLRLVKLHPALQTASCKCLLDFVKEDSLQKSAENCGSSHTQFENKVLQFKLMFNDVKRKVEDLFSSRTSFPVKSLEANIKEHQRFINEQKSIMQSLSKDVDTVKKLVDDCVSCQLSSSLRPHDAVSALGPMYDVHAKNHLPRMQACDRAVSKLLDFCKDKKIQMNNFLHHYMQKIAYFSYIIKDVKLQFPVFKEAMGRQDNLFMDLKLVRGIGPAYRACLSEVVRRKACMKLYMGMAGQMAERLARKREDEVRRREEFVTEHGSYLPRDVIESMGLNDIPNPCDVHITPYDDRLIDVDISDIDHYAPEYLLGLPSKSEKQGIKNSSLNLVGTSSSVEAEEISKDTFESYDSEELVEGSELVEIAGTSKMEVENAKLKADLASALAMICSFSLEYDSLGDSKPDSILKNAAEKTAEALRLKDEYGRRLQFMLKTKQMQCESYERRIKELEQRLSDQYLQGKNLSNSDFAVLAEKSDNCKPQIVGGPEAPAPYISTTEPMDEVSCISNSLDTKLGIFAGQPGRAAEAVDENMMDSRGDQNPHLDSSMMEQNREEFQENDKYVRDRMVGHMGISLTNSSTAESMPRSLNVLPCETVEDPSLESNLENGLLLELQNELADKTTLLSETETKLKGAMEEVAVLKRELEASRKLLDESQMNCAHLENCLHEAREEAQTHLCAADRRASEYSALRASAVKMRGLFERLRSCVYASGGVASFAHSMRTLAQSLANSGSDNENDGTIEFRKCICTIADRVGFLAKHREELLEKYPKLEAANEQLMKELEEKKELVQTLYAKHQLEKQANKEKISFGRMEVHEIAAFVRNAAGHYEAINRNCANYYLSAESVALFADNLLTRSNYIVGQIVHIERQTVKPSPPSPRPDHGRADQTDCVISDSGTDRLTLNSGLSSNPYSLPVGCEYFIVTVAMLPDTAIHSTAS